MNMTLKAAGFLWLFVCTGIPLLAQQGLVTTGGDLGSSSGSVSYSVGQIVYTNIPGEDGSISQGIQQPITFQIVGLHDLHEALSISVFPNPASQFLQIQFTDPQGSFQSEPYTARLYDPKGNLLLTQALQHNINTISLESLTSSMYLLQVWQQHRFIQAYALIKSN
jgi:hypothetical protein